MEETKKIEDCSDLELKAAGFDIAGQLELCQSQIREIVGELARRKKARESEAAATDVAPVEAVKVQE
jgi:hypothetical protein